MRHTPRPFLAVPCTGPYTAVRDGHAESVVSPGQGAWDTAKCSEMCVFRLPRHEGQIPRYRLVYEACDGTAKNERGVWRVASATSAA